MATVHGATKSNQCHIMFNLVPCTVCAIAREFQIATECANSQDIGIAAFMDEAAQGRIRTYQPKQFTNKSGFIGRR
jgi:hypothetical protein